MHPDNDQRPNQLTLLAGADAVVLEEQERSGEFTGERLRRCRPEVYRAILEGFAGGASMRRLASLYHVSSNTVSAVVQSEAVAIEALKKRIGRKATAVYALAFDRLEEDLHNDYVMGKTSAKDKAVIVGILGDRSQIEQGLPTAVVEHRRVDAADVNDAFLDAIEVQAVEQSRKTGFGRGEPGQKGLPGGAGSGGRGAGSVPGEGEFEGEPEQAEEAVGDDKSPVDGSEGADFIGEAGE